MNQNIEIMVPVYKFETISAFNAFNNHNTLHPLVSVLDFSKAAMRTWDGAKTVRVNYGFYCIILKQVKCGDLKYGCNYYDYQEGTLVFISPGQVVQIETTGEPYQPTGYGLAFHADLIHGTALGKQIRDYSFFGYESHEALHISEKERQTVMDCFNKISTELEGTIDRHSKRLIASNIELFLNYCIDFMIVSLLRGKKSIKEFSDNLPTCSMITFSQANYKPQACPRWLIAQISSIYRPIILGIW